MADETRNSRHGRREGFADRVLPIAALLAFVFGCAWLCVLDDRAGRLALQFFKPAVDLFVKSEPHLARAGETYPLAGFILAGTLFLGALLSVWSKRSRPTSLALLSLAIALLAEVSMLKEQFNRSFTLYGVSALLFLFSLLLEKQRRADPDPTLHCEPGRRTELLLLGIIIAAGAFLRFYALNQVVDSFEGELTPFSVGATKLSAFAAANAGIGGPWAPLGILYYVPIWVTSILFDASIVSLRLSSALVGILTIPVVFVFLRYSFGSFVALCGSFFFAFDSLHVGWSRTDVHPHGVTTWPALLLCLCTVKAIQEAKHRHLACMALLMGLTWHQYPSGQSAFLIPIVAIFLSAIFDPAVLKRLKWKLLWFPLGVVLWFFGLPLSYYLATGSWRWDNPFILTGERSLWAGWNGGLEAARAIFSSALLHARDYVDGIFFEARFLFHQDILPIISPYRPRTFPWMLAACLPCAFLLLGSQIKNRRAGAIVLLAWVAVALLPGCLSKEPFPKRSATFYAALDCVAAVYIGWLLLHIRAYCGKAAASASALLMAILFAIYFCVCCAFWFSGRQWKYGVPGEALVAQRTATYLRPGSIVIADLWEDYSEGKILWLMLDQLQDPKFRPNAWIFASPPDEKMWARYACRPRAAVEELRPSFWAYSWSGLSSQIEEIQSAPSWNRAIFLLKDRRHPPDSQEPDTLKVVRTCCPGASVEKIPQQASLKTDYYIAVCDRDL